MEQLSLFISHSSHDREIVKSLVDLVERSGKMPSGSIRCTSIPGYGLELGTSTPDRLREDLAACRLVVGVITRNSLKAPWVFFELGAAWGQSTETILLLSRAISNDELSGPFAQINHGRLNDFDSLEGFADQVITRLEVEPRPLEQRKPVIESITKSAKYLGDDPAYDIITSLREFINVGAGRNPGKDYALVNNLDVFLHIDDPDRRGAYVAALQSLIGSRAILAKESDHGLAVTLNPELCAG
jgi:hypothetical protein